MDELPSQVYLTNLNVPVNLDHFHSNSTCLFFLTSQFGYWMWFININLVWTVCKHNHILCIIKHNCFAVITNISKRMSLHTERHAKKHVRAQCHFVKQKRSWNGPLESTGLLMWRVFLPRLINEAGRSHPRLTDFLVSSNCDFHRNEAHALFTLLFHW